MGVGGGDPFLGVSRQEGEQGVAAIDIEFPEDIVEEVDGRRGRKGSEEFALSEFEREREGSLLAFAGEIGGGHAMDEEGEVIAVRADDGLAEAEFFGASEVDRCAEVGVTGRRVGKSEGFVTTADVCVCLGREGSDGRERLGAAVHDGLAVFDEDGLVGKDFGERWVGVFEQEIFDLEGTAVA